jgi:hypothetical protein
MTCPSDETLVLFADSEDNQPTAELTAHLDSCTACDERVRELRLALSEWRSTDLVDADSYSADYFAPIGADIERALDLSTAREAPRVVTGASLWWQRPALAAAVAAALLIAVGLLRAPPQSTAGPEAALATTESLEEVARELGRGLLDAASEDALVDDQASLSFLASWNLDQAELFDELPPLPLTTTLADEFDLLSAEQVDSLIKRL